VEKRLIFDQDDVNSRKNLFFTYQYVNVILTFTLMFQIHGFVFLMSIKQEIFTVHNTCCQDIIHKHNR
jgi:hypothetical protein